MTGRRRSFDEAEAVDDCFDDFDGMMHDLEDVRDRREQLLHVLELMETEPVRSQLREFLGEDNAFETAEDEVDDDSDLEEFDDESDFDEEDDTLSRSELMARLNEAMAAGDEERAGVPPWASCRSCWRFARARPRCAPRRPRPG